MAKRLLTSDDKSLIRTLRLKKGWGSLRMIREFPQRQWKRSTLKDLIKKIDETGDANRKQGIHVAVDRRVRVGDYQDAEIMISVAVSQLGKSSLVFVEHEQKLTCQFILL